MFILFLIFIAAIVTSIISSSFGFFGGTLLLGILKELVPLAVLIPIHGVAQLSSNFFRATMLLPHISFSLTIPFLMGAAIASFLAAEVLLSLPPAALNFTIGFFILWSTWFMPNLKKTVPSKFFFNDRIIFFFLGIILTFLSVFIGATGPLLGPFLLNTKLTKEQMIATQASAQIFTHLFKVIAFYQIGIRLGEYSTMIARLVAGVFIGTFLGTKLLKSFSENTFRMVLKIILTVLALRMIFVGIGIFN